MSADRGGEDPGRPQERPGAGGGSDRRTEPGPAQAEPSRQLPNPALRALQVFVSPARLFDRLQRTPAWAGMLAVAIVVSLGSVYFLPPELMEQVLRAEMGPEVTEDQVETALGAGRWLAYAGAVLGPAVLAGALAGFLYFLYTLVLGGRGEFRPLFAVSVHAILIVAVGEAALTGLMVATGDAQVRLALHLLVSGLDDDAYLYGLLRGLNVFGLWTACVLGIGVSRLYDRRSAAGAAGLLVALYVVGKALLALLPGV